MLRLVSPFFSSHYVSPSVGLLPLLHCSLVSLCLFVMASGKNLQMAAEELHECKMCVVNGVNTFFIQPDRPTTIKLCVSFGFNLPEANECEWFGCS